MATHDSTPETTHGSADTSATTTVNPNAEDDAYFDHSGEAAAMQAHAEVVDPRALAITLVAMTFGVAFVIIVLVIYFKSYVSQQTAQKTEGWSEVSRQQSAMREEQTLADQPSWISQADGRVSIPEERAIDRVLNEYAADGQSDAGTVPQGGG